MYGRVEAACTPTSCTTCRLIEERGTSGFFGNVETSPKAIADGKIVGECCRAAVNYTYTTGFTKINLKDFEIQGQLGQSGQGSVALGIRG